MPSKVNSAQGSYPFLSVLKENVLRYLFTLLQDNRWLLTAYLDDQKTPVKEVNFQLDPKRRSLIIMHVLKEDGRTETYNLMVIASKER